MGAARSIFFVSILGGLLTMLSVRPAICQWVQLADFSEAVSCVYFLDDVNLPNVGFAGAGGDIFRSLDGGVTWTKVVMNLPGGVTSFCFKDGTTGWCSINGLGTSNAIYQTVNGGATWTPMNVIGIGSDVCYNATNGLLFLSLRQTTSNSLISSDGGTTWRTFNKEINENGFAFCDPMHGMLTSLNVTYGTSDGGQTWAVIPLGLHSWSPCAIPGTSTFVAANDMLQRVYNSTDAGVTWNEIPGIPASDQLTGCVQPGKCGVYVQTYKGIYVSPTLSGWTFLYGPGNTFDTRFFSGTSFVYAGNSDGAIQKLPKSAIDWPTVQMSPVAISVTEAIGCPQPTAIATFQNISCLPLDVLSALVTDSVQWILTPDSLPVTLNTNDTIQFHLATAGQTAGTSKSNLQLVIRTSAGTTDTSLPLTISVQGVIPPTIQPVAVALRDKCTPLDTVFRIKNNHCDTIRITSLSMIDSSLFSIGSFSLPVILPPDSECIVPVSAKPKGKGLFNDTAAVTLTYGNFQLDTTVGLLGRVPASDVAATFSDSTMAFGAVSGCQSKIDTVYMKNTACDSAQITLAQLGISSAFKVLSNVLNTWLAPGDSVAIVVELPGSATNGNVSDELDLILDNGTFREEFPVALSGQKVDVAPVTILSTNNIARDSILPCTVFDTTVTMTFVSPCPDSLMISGLQYSGSGNITVTSSQTLPYILHSGDTLKYLVTYSPKAGEVVSGNIEIQGAGLDTTLAVHFSSSEAGAGLLSISAERSTLSAKFCDEDSVYIEIHNTGCGPAVMDSLALQSLFPNQTQFTMTPVTLPLTIPAADSIPVKVYYAGDGNGDDAAKFLARETGGNILTQPLSGSTIPTPTVRVGIALTPQSTLNPVAGSVTTPYLYFVDAVQASGQLLSLNCDVAFNGNVLNDLQPVGQNGWSVQELSSTQTGMSLAFTRATATNIAAGDEIATLPLEAFISDSLSTPIDLTSVDFSPNDPNYERCTLASAIDPPSLNVQLTPQCGDSELSASLRGDKLVISSVQVMPNPLGKDGASELTISFVSSEQALATVTISDVLGRARATASASASIGSNSIDIPCTALDEGVYYVDLSEERTHVVTRVSVIGDR